jgi:hypothetical protein
MRDDAGRLALEIVRCPVVDAVLRGIDSSCRDIVLFQKGSVAKRWVPEPWSGHLDEAPILFLSSNPSSGSPGEEPAAEDITAASDDETILHTYTDAFEPGAWMGIHEGAYLRGADGRVGKFVAYWGSCKSRASEILQRPATPGRDYALTEVVHCGSKNEWGVRPAAVECVPRYLDRLLRLSPAVVVIVIGAVARDIVRSMVPRAATGATYVGPIEWAGKDRHVVFLPHPNARRVPKGVAANLGDQAAPALASIRAALGQTV